MNVYTTDVFPTSETIQFPPVREWVELVMSANPRTVKQIHAELVKRGYDIHPFDVSNRLRMDRSNGIRFPTIPKDCV